MVVGVDFDNTIVCYDELFHRIAVERDLVPEKLPANKGRIRDYLRRQAKEDIWTELQGYVYGARMLEAEPFPGVLEFFTRCSRKNIRCCIISHRTRHPYLGPEYDLHKSAGEWIQHYGFYEHAGLTSENIFFEVSLQGKLDRIAKTKCDVFIDDLPEFLAEIEFAGGIERILFDPNNLYRNEKRFRRRRTWQQITQLIIDEVRVF